MFTTSIKIIANESAVFYTCMQISGKTFLMYLRVICRQQLVLRKQAQGIPSVMKMNRLFWKKWSFLNLSSMWP